MAKVNEEYNKRQEEIQKRINPNADDIVNQTINTHVERNAFAKTEDKEKHTDSLVDEMNRYNNIGDNDDKTR